MRIKDLLLEDNPHTQITLIMGVVRKVSTVGPFDFILSHNEGEPNQCWGHINYDVTRSFKLPTSGSPRVVNLCNAAAIGSPEQLAEVLENIFWSLLADHIKDLGPLEPPESPKKSVWERLDEEF